ncbi:MAG: hypothetical protein R6V04_15975 [bacterium]
MYYITYKNFLKFGKTIDDYFHWLKTYWPLYEKWGADNVKVWQGKNNRIFCQYKVKNIDRWIKMMTSKEAENLIFSFNSIIEPDHFSVKIFFEKNSQLRNTKNDISNYNAACLSLYKRVDK